MPKGKYVHKDEKNILPMVKIASENAMKFAAYNNNFRWLFKFQANWSSNSESR